MQWPKERGQTTQWPKEQGKRVKQRSIQHDTENYRSSHSNPTLNRGCPGRVRNSRSPCDTRRAILVLQAAYAALWNQIHQVHSYIKQKRKKLQINVDLEMSNLFCTMEFSLQHKHYVLEKAKHLKRGTKSVEDSQQSSFHFPISLHIVYLDFINL